MPSKGRPPKPIDPEAPPAAAALGRELRGRRLALDLTLEAVAARAGCSPQHVSGLELAKTYVTRPCAAALDAALGADGALLALLPAAVHERALAAQARADARYDGGDVDPTNRRGLFGAGVAVLPALALPASAPARARQVDPELPEHWTNLLRLLGRHDAAHGPREVLGVVRPELRVIAEHRGIARGDLRVTFMRVEARWTQFAAWLSNDTGLTRDRDALADRALRLASEADYPDMCAFIGLRQSQWAAQDADARRAIAHAEAALRVRGMSEAVRGRCALRAAYGYALANQAAACQRYLAEGEGLMERADSPRVPPWAGHATIRSHVRPDEARCWLAMKPSKAVPLYEGVLRHWPRDRVRDRGLHQARLALACAAAGELDRARAEGRMALAITSTTGSNGAARELKRLGAALQAA